MSDIDPASADKPWETGPRPVALLTGASSQLGVFLVPRLLAAGYRVIALSRQVPIPADEQVNPLWISPGILDADEPVQAVSDFLDSAEVLVSCGPLGLANRILSRCHGLRRIVVFSTSSVFTKAESAVPQERHQIAGIIREEKTLRSACEVAGVDCVLLRPTLIYGCGLDRNLSLLVRWIRRLGWLPVAGSAAGLRQPVHADDLAELAIAALAARGSLSLDSPACGGETLSYYQMVERLFISQGMSPRVIRTPPLLLTLGLSVMKWFGLGKGVTSEMVRRQGIDLLFDDAELKRKLAYSPRSFAPSPQDFEIPSASAQLRPLPRQSD